MDLVKWLESLSIKLPKTSEQLPKKTKLNASLLPVPVDLETSIIHASVGFRNPGNSAVNIEHINITAEKVGFSALGTLFIAYALSPQLKPLHLRLEQDKDKVQQITILPSKSSALEVCLGFRCNIHEVLYRPKLFKENPNYTTMEQDEKDYPREHLPYCRPGSPNTYDIETFGSVRNEEPVCIYFQGTAPSLIWLGKFLLNLSLDDSNVQLSYLYNLFPPAESMSYKSAELRLTVADFDGDAGQFDSRL